MNKLWIASLVPELTPEQLEVFDNEADARNFSMEMAASSLGRYTIIETPVNMRGSKISGEPHWVDYASLHAHCIECIQEDFSAKTGVTINEKDCAEFMEKHGKELQKKSDEIVQEYIKKTISDYINNERIVLG